MQTVPTTAASGSLLGVEHTHDNGDHRGPDFSQQHHPLDGRRRSEQSGSPPVTAEDRHTEAAAAMEGQVPMGGPPDGGGGHHHGAPPPGVMNPYAAQQQMNPQQMSHPSSPPSMQAAPYPFGGGQVQHRAPTGGGHFPVMQMPPHGYGPPQGYGPGMGGGMMSGPPHPSLHMGGMPPGHQFGGAPPMGMGPGRMPMPGGGHPYLGFQGGGHGGPLATGPGGLGMRRLEKSAALPATTSVLDEPMPTYPNALTAPSRLPAHKPVRLQQPKHPLAPPGTAVFFKYGEEHYPEETVPEQYTYTESDGTICRYITSFLVYNKRGERLLPIEVLDQPRHGALVLYGNLLLASQMAAEQGRGGGRSGGNPMSAGVEESQDAVDGSDRIHSADDADGDDDASLEGDSRRAESPVSGRGRGRGKRGSADSSPRRGSRRRAGSDAGFREKKEKGNGGSAGSSSAGGGGFPTYPVRVELAEWCIDYGQEPSNIPFIWLISRWDVYYRLEKPAGRYIPTFGSAKMKFEVSTRIIKGLQHFPMEDYQKLVGRICAAEKLERRRLKREQRQMDRGPRRMQRKAQRQAMRDQAKAAAAAGAAGDPLGGTQQPLAQFSQQLSQSLGQQMGAGPQGAPGMHMGMHMGPPGAPHMSAMRPMQAGGPPGGVFCGQPNFGLPPQNHAAPSGGNGGPFRGGGALMNPQSAMMMAPSPQTAVQGHQQGPPPAGGVGGTSRVVGGLKVEGVGESGGGDQQAPAEEGNSRRGSRSVAATGSGGDGSDMSHCYGGGTGGGSDVGDAGGAQRDSVDVRAPRGGEADGDLQDHENAAGDTGGSGGVHEDLRVQQQGSVGGSEAGMVVDGSAGSHGGPPPQGNHVGGQQHMTGVPMGVYGDVGGMQGSYNGPGMDRGAPFCGGVAPGGVGMGGMPFRLGNGGVMKAEMGGAGGMFMKEDFGGFGGMLHHPRQMPPMGVHHMGVMMTMGGPPKLPPLSAFAAAAAADMRYGGSFALMGGQAAVKKKTRNWKVHSLSTPEGTGVHLDIGGKSGALTPWGAPYAVECCREETILNLGDFLDSQMRNFMDGVGASCTNLLDTPFMHILREKAAVRTERMHLFEDAKKRVYEAAGTPAGMAAESDVRALTRLLCLSESDSEGESSLDDTSDEEGSDDSNSTAGSGVGGHGDGPMGGLNRKRHKSATDLKRLNDDNFDNEFESARDDRVKRVVKNEYTDGSPARRNKPGRKPGSGVGTRGGGGKRGRGRGRGKGGERGGKGGVGGKRQEDSGELSRRASSEGLRHSARQMQQRGSGDGEFDFYDANSDIAAGEDDEDFVGGGGESRSRRQRDADRTPHGPEDECPDSENEDSFMAPPRGYTGNVKDEHDADHANQAWSTADGGNRAGQVRRGGAPRGRPRKHPAPGGNGRPQSSAATTPTNGGRNGNKGGRGSGNAPLRTSRAGRVYGGNERSQYTASVADSEFIEDGDGPLGTADGGAGGAGGYGVNEDLSAEAAGIDGYALGQFESVSGVEADPAGGLPGIPRDLPDEKADELDLPADCERTVSAFDTGNHVVATDGGDGILSSSCVINSSAAETQAPEVSDASGCVGAATGHASSSLVDDPTDHAEHVVDDHQRN